MRWFWAYATKYDCKSHAIPEPLLSGVIKNLEDRNFSEMSTKEIKSVEFDLPGMAMVDRHIHDIEVDGLKIRIPSTDIEEFLERARQLQARNEIGQKYYKLHGFYKCICFTPELRNRFIDKLAIIEPKARAIALAENKEFNQRIKQISKKVGFEGQKRPTKNSLGEA